jgi:hypothetical protein
MSDHGDPQSALPASWCVRRVLQVGRSSSRGLVRHARKGCVLLVAIAAIPMASCGSSDPTAQFKTGYNALRQPFNQTANAIGSAVQHAPTQTDAQIHATFQNLAQHWQGQLSKLETLKPPKNVASQFNTITDDATRIDSDLDAIVSAASTDSASAAEQASASLAADATALKAATTQLRKQLGIK